MSPNAWNRRLGTSLRFNQDAYWLMLVMFPDRFSTWLRCGGEVGGLCCTLHSFTQAKKIYWKISPSKRRFHLKSCECADDGWGFFVKVNMQARESSSEHLHLHWSVDGKIVAFLMYFFGLQTAINPSDFFPSHKTELWLCAVSRKKKSLCMVALFFFPGFNQTAVWSDAKLFFTVLERFFCSFPPNFFFSQPQ